MKRGLTHLIGTLSRSSIRAAALARTRAPLQSVFRRSIAAPASAFSARLVFTQPAFRAHSTTSMANFEKVELKEGDKVIPVHVFGDKAKPGVIVIQEWWGVNEQIKIHAAKIAASGYRVLIPDLYRGKVGLDAEEASHLMGTLDFKNAVEDIRAAAKYLKEEGSEKVGVTGFCMGGALTIASNTLVDDIAAGVCFYGIPPAELADPAVMKTPIQCHFGNKDSMAGFSDADAANALEEKLKAAGVPYEFFRYENVGHAFMNEAPEAVKLRKSMGIQYEDKEAIDNAWTRAFDFFKKYLQ